MPELDDYSAPILIQDLEFHLDLFSRKFLAKVASIHQDTLLFQFGSRAAALGKRVGERKAWDVAGEVYRALRRQAFPTAPHFSTVDGFALDFDDLSKPGLLKLIRTYWDQWLKVGMYWVGQANQLCGPQEMVAISEEHYEAMCRYQIPKLAEIAGVYLDHVVGYSKANQLGIDATQGYRSVKEIITDDTVNVSLHDCDVWGKFREQGVFDDHKALAMCEREATLCSRLHGFPRNTCVIPKKPAAGFKGVAPGEPVCIMQYKRADPMT
jgi:hypothetical protein